MSSLAVLGGSANPSLGVDVARALGTPLGECTMERFPDGELHVEIDPRGVEGRDVFVVEPTSPAHARAASAASKSASDDLLELLLIADACHRAFAHSVSAVIPYFAYARQDRRKKPGDALGARVVAQALGTARLARIVGVDLHSDVVAAALDVPLEALTALPLLASALKSQIDGDSVVVAPDFGAVRLAREYARLLRLPFAVVHKVRSSGRHVDVERVAGDVRGLQPIIVDDMIATGGTIIAAAEAIRAEGARGEVVVAGTHAVLTPGAMDRLRREARVRRLFVTDTIALGAPEPDITVVSVAPLLADCIVRHERDRGFVGSDQVREK